jgi:hypothetical protein
MVSPAAVRRYGRDFGRHPSGTGPLSVLRLAVRRRVTLTRFTDYHGEPAASRRLIFRPITDPMTRVAELMAGGIDLALELSPDNVAAFRQRPAYRVLEATGPHLWFLILNLRDGPLADLRVRRAVDLAVDRQALVHDVLRDTAEPHPDPCRAPSAGPSTRSCPRTRGAASGHARHNSPGAGPCWPRPVMPMACSCAFWCPAAAPACSRPWPWRPPSRAISPASASTRPSTAMSGTPIWRASMPAWTPTRTWPRWPG